MPNRTDAEKVSFLIKLWLSGNLQSPIKYDTILKYFVRHLLSIAVIEQDDEQQVDRLLKLQHPHNYVTTETKIAIVERLRDILKESSSTSAITLCLEFTSNDSFKEFFKLHLNIYCDLLQSVILNFNNGVAQEPKFLPIFKNIVAELYCFAKVDSFKQLFLKNILAPLSTSSKYSADKTAWYDLIKSIFFSQSTTTSESSLKFFDQEFENDERNILLEAFIVISKSKPQEIVKLFVYITENVLSACGNDVEFLSQTRDIFLLLNEQEIDLAPIKRQQPEMFKNLASRLSTAIEANRKSKDFLVILKTLAALLHCDAFLFDKNIFNILVDCMMREKTSEELASFESLLSVVIKIYGKDINQFLKKLLKSVDEKLDSFTIEKKSKRKLLSGSDADVTTKRQRLSSGKTELVSGRGAREHKEGIQLECVPIGSISAHFAEAVGGLNVAQSITLWTQLNDFLNKSLKKFPITENVLFKIDFASNLLTDLFTNTRLHEQLMYKQTEVASLTKEFHETQNLFYEIIVNVEYNSVMMNAFLKMASGYENFSMLFYYHHDADIRNELESLFTGNQSKFRSEWKIIQQRIKNFGKAEEKNHLNKLIIQQRKKNDLFKFTDERKFEDFFSIHNDSKQIDYLLQFPDTRSFFINSMAPMEHQHFARHLIKLSDKELQSAALNDIARNQTLLETFVTELLRSVDENEFKSVLDILAQLPLACLSDDSKKLVFDDMLKEKHSDELRSLVELVTLNLFQNDSYKLVFKVFTMNKVVEKFGKEESAIVFHTILSNAARKLNIEALDNFEWIIQNDDPKLLIILAQVATEVKHCFIFNFNICRRVE